MNNLAEQSLSEKILDVSGVTEAECYFEIIPYTNSLGFSLKRTYPDHFANVSQTLAEKPQSVALISVDLYPEKIPNSNGLAQVVITIETVIPRQDGRCEVLNHNERTMPHEISDSTSCRYDLRLNNFVECNGTPVDMKRLLQSLFELHVAPCLPIWGFFLRLQRARHDFLIKELQFEEKIIRFFLWAICGKRLGDDNGELFPTASVEDLSSTDAIAKYQGISVAVHTILSYFAFVALTYLIFFLPFNISLPSFVEIYWKVVGGLAIPVILCMAYCLPPLFVWLVNGCRKNFKRALCKEGSIKHILGFYFLQAYGQR